MWTTSYPRATRSEHTIVMTTLLRTKLRRVVPQGSVGETQGCLLAAGTPRVTSLPLPARLVVGRVYTAGQGARRDDDDHCGGQWRSSQYHVSGTVEGWRWQGRSEPGREEVNQQMRQVAAGRSAES